MTAEIRTGIAMLEAKTKLIAEHSHGGDIASYLEFGGKEPSLKHLRSLDNESIDPRLRRLPKEKQGIIRARLVAQFGRSTVGDGFDVVAKRVLQRGAVANDEEEETIRELADCQIDLLNEALGEEDASRLTGLWSVYVYGGRTNAGPKK